MSQRSNGYIFVTAQSGFGKTALLANWVKALPLDDQDVCYHFISRLDRLADEESMLLNLCKQLMTFHELSGEPPTRIAEMRSLYLALLDTPPPEGRRLVVLLDGLDEALNWSPGFDLFPPSLPEGVVIVFSAREISDWNWIAKLKLSRNAVDTLRLEMLGTAEIAHLLERAGGMAAIQANKAKFVETLHKVSQGDPFYLHFLLKDIENGDIHEENIDQLPVGLDEYLTEWWDQLINDVVNDREAAFELLGILTIAKGPLLAQELVDISQELGKRALLNRLLDGKLRRYLIGNPQDGYALCHPRLGEYLKAKEKFSSRELQDFREKLLSYCERWQEHKSKYVLSFYPAHLFELGYANDLYALINKAWMDAQFEHAYSYMAFSSHTELAIILAEAETPPNIVQIARNSLIYATIGSLANNIPLVALKVLTAMGRWEEAQGYATLMPSVADRCEALCQIGLALMGQHKMAEARASFARAVRDAESTDNQAAKAQQLAKVAKALAQTGEQERAEEIANQAIQLLLALPDSKNRSSSLMSIASVFAQAGLGNFFVTALNESKESRGRIAVMVELLATAVKRGYVEETIQYADTIHYGNNPVPNCLVRVGLAHTLFEAGKTAQAAEIVDRLPALIEPITNQFIKLLLLAQVATAFSWIGKGDRAADLIKQAEELSEMITTEAERPWALASVTKSLAQIGLVKQALLVADSIVESEPESNAYALRAKGEALTEVAKALALAGADEQALVLSTTAELLKQARFAGGTHPVEYVLPDEVIWGRDEELPVIVNVIKIMVEAGRIEKAKTAAGEIRDPSTRYAALLDIARSEARNNRVEEAWTVIEGINDSLEKARTQAIIAEILLDAGDKAQAKVMVEQAIAQSKALPDPWSETAAIGELSRMLAQAGQKKLAIKVAETITKKRAWAFVAIAQSLIDQGDALSGTALVEQAVSLANQTSNWFTTAVRLHQQQMSRQLSFLLSESLLLKVAMVLMRVEQRVRAREIVAQVIEASAAYDGGIRETIVAEGASTLARLDQAKQALALTNTMRSSWYAIPVLAEITNAFLRAGDTEAGEQTLSRANKAIQALLKSNGWGTGPTITEFIIILAQGGQVQRALSVFEDVNTLLRHISSKACTEIIQALAREGKITKAREIAQAALTMAEEVKDRSTKVSNLTTVIEGLNSPDMDDLISTAIDCALAAAENQESRRSTQAGIVKALAQAGAVDRALVIAESITHLGYRQGMTMEEFNALEALARALVKVEQKARAIDIVHQITKTAGSWSLLVIAITLYTKLEAHQQATSTLIKAFSQARVSSRAAVFKTLEAGYPLLTAVDGIYTLLHLHDALQEAENWWFKQISISFRPAYKVRLFRSVFER